MRVFLLVLGLLATAPLEAQYRRGVLVYDSSCPLRYDNQLQTSNGVRLTVNNSAYGVRSLETAFGATVTLTSTRSGATPQSVTTSARFPSALYTDTDAGTSCNTRLKTMSTDSLVSWARSIADNAERERRSWGRIRNVLLLGGVAVLGATAYNFNNEVERDGEGDAVTLLAGTALGFTIGYLAFNQAQPEVADYTRTRNRYRDMERGILEQAR